MVTLNYIGQTAMDDFYQNYRGNADFFGLEDFVFRAGAIIGEYYQKLFMAKYNELRQEKINKAELVGFNVDMLSQQDLTLKLNKEMQEYRATLSQPVMTFTFDQSETGYQLVMPLTPRNVNIERTSISELWQVQYLPFTNRIFWYPDNGELVFLKKGNCNVSKVRLYYVPSLRNKDGEVIADAPISDAIVQMAVTTTVAAMKQEAQGVVVKETNDLNPNKNLESEINKNALR